MRRVVVKVDYGKMRIEDYDEQEEQSQSMQSDVTKSLDTLSSLTGGGNAFGGATF